MYVHDVLGLAWDVYMCSAAAAIGSLDCLSYAHASGCPWNSKTCEVAARVGNLHCLAYAHEHGCEWGTTVLHDATRYGQLECLKCAHTHGCPIAASLPASVSLVDSGMPLYLTTQAVYASSMPCLAYVHEVLGCAWDPEGTEYKLAFQRGDLELLQYIHSHGGVLCTQFELLCPNRNTWLSAFSNDVERKAMCLLYVHCYCGCQVKGVWNTKVGSLALEIIKAKRLALLLSFRAAGKTHVGGPLIAAAHDAMQRMPNDILQEVICAAGLQVVE